MIRFIISTVALIIAALTVASCSSEPTVQRYFVDKSGEEGFVAFDIAPSIIKTDKLKLSEKEKKAVDCLHNINILIYKADSTNLKAFDREKADVKNRIKGDKYDELIKFNSKEGGGSISTKGEGEHLEEFVVFLHKKGDGLGLVRVTGEDMTPDKVMTIAGLISKGGLDMEQLKPLQQMMGTQPEAKPAKP